jgi:hypothetical protein
LVRTSFASSIRSILFGVLIESMTWNFLASMFIAIVNQ